MKRPFVTILDAMKKMAFLSLIALISLGCGISTILATPTPIPTLTSTPTLTPTATLTPTMTPTRTPRPTKTPEPTLGVYFLGGKVMISIDSVEIHDEKTVLGDKEYTPSVGDVFLVVTGYYTGNLESLLEDDLQTKGGLYIEDSTGDEGQWLHCRWSSTYNTFEIGFFATENSAPYVLKSDLGKGISVNLEPFMED